MGENKMRHIRNKFGDIIYCIRDDGTITDKFDCDVVGHLKGDRITDKFDIDTLYRIRQDGTITDKYDCDIIGHIREDGSITDKYDIDTQGRVDVPHSSGGSSDTGCLGSIFSLIGLLIIGLFKLIFYYYKFALLYLMFPIWSTVTVYCFSIVIIIGILGVSPDIVLVLSVIASVLVLISLPYWVILFIQKKKRRMTWKETFKYYGKWFIKGPWAYKDIIELKNKPMGD